MADAPQTITWAVVALALINSIPAIMSYLLSRANNKKLDENTKLTKDVHDKVESRVDELQCAQVALAREEGRREGVLSEQQKQILFAKTIVQREAERSSRLIRLRECVTGNGALRLPVLVVEDNEIDAIELCRILDNFHLTCETVITGDEAMRMAHEKKYAAIFIDLSLHGEIGGLRLVKMLFAEDLTLPIFIVTSYAAQEIHEAARLMGVMDVIEKPASEEKLQKAFSKA